MVDYYLLNDEDKLKEFCCYTNLTKLNKLELVLLGHASSKFNKKFSDSIVSLLKSKSDLVKVP